MILRAFATLLAITASVPATAAPPVVRALFVGIDHYRWSSTNVEDAGFKDLRGAVGDSQRFKEAVRAAYHLDLDVTKPKQCRSANAVSITLTDECATREKLLGALADLIVRSAAGDTVLFYYAGHGSQMTDDQEFESASGHYQTILPSDARNPSAQTKGDILDKELRGYIDQATAKGVNVVTVFDSCNSATATRGQRVVNGKRPPRVDLGEPRYAGSLQAHDIQRPPPPPMLGAGGGYRVHLGASRDDQQAREAPEVAGGSDRQGLFTTALVDVLGRSPQATFADLIVAVSEQVNTATDGKQTPQGEGALNARLGGPDRPIPLFDVSFDKTGQPMLGAGQLSGITEGSSFALFASFADALRNGGQPLTLATAGAPDIGGAPLTLTGAANSLPARMVARELTHKWGSGIVSIDDNQVPGDHLAQIEGAFSRIPLVRLAKAHEGKSRYILTEISGGHFQIAGPGVILPLGPLDADFETRLDQNVRKIARVESLLALENSPPGERLCVAEGDYPPRTCPPLTQGPVRTVAVRAPLKITARNINPEGAARYLYVLLIDQAYAITLLQPKNRGIDDPMPVNQPLSRLIALTDPGTYRFVTIASDVRIQPAALEQTGVTTRDTTAPSAKGWTASVSEVTVIGGNK